MIDLGDLPYLIAVPERLRGVFRRLSMTANGTLQVVYAEPRILDAIVVDTTAAGLVQLNAGPVEIGAVRINLHRTSSIIDVTQVSGHLPSGEENS